MNGNFWGNLSNEKVMKFEKATKVVGILAIIFETINLALVIYGIIRLGLLETFGTEVFIKSVISMVAFEIGQIAVLVIWVIGITKKTIPDKWLYGVVWIFLLLNVAYDIYSGWGFEDYFSNNVWFFLSRIIVIVVMILGTVISKERTKFKAVIGTVMVVYTGKFIYDLVNSTVRVFKAQNEELSDILTYILYGEIQPLLLFATMIMFAVWIVFLKDSNIGTDYDSIDYDNTGYDNTGYDSSNSIDL